MTDRPLSAQKPLPPDLAGSSLQPLIVTAAVIHRDGRILVTRRPPSARHGGLWEFPGGKLEAGETPADALQRELREELDLPIVVGEIFAVVHHRYPWGAVLILAYRCTPAHLRVRNLQVAEHRWLTAEELGSLPFLPADLPLIERLIQEAPRDSSA